MKPHHWRYAIYPVHAFVALFAVVIFCTTAYTCYYSEIQRKSIKTLLLYDVTLNDISLVKIFTISVIGILLTSLVVNLTFLPETISGDLVMASGLQVIILWTALCMIILTVVSIYAFHILIPLRITTRFRPLWLHMPLSFLSFLATEAFIRWICFENDISYDPGHPPHWAYVIYFSPLHMVGKFAGISLGFGGLDASAVVVPLIAIVILIAGYILSRPLRLDILME